MIYFVYKTSIPKISLKRNLLHFLLPDNFMDITVLKIIVVENALKNKKK